MSFTDGKGPSSQSFSSLETAAALALTHVCVVAMRGGSSLKGAERDSYYNSPEAGHPDSYRILLRRPHIFSTCEGKSAHSNPCKRCAARPPPHVSSPPPSSYESSDPPCELRAASAGATTAAKTLMLSAVWSAAVLYAEFCLLCLGVVAAAVAAEAYGYYHSKSNSRRREEGAAFVRRRRSWKVSRISVREIFREEFTDELDYHDLA